MYEFGYVIGGVHKNKFGKIIKMTKDYVYLRTNLGEVIKVSKKNVSFYNPALTWEEAKALAQEWERYEKERIRSMPKRPRRGKVMKMATGGKVEKREKMGREEYKFKGKGKCVYKGKYIQIYQGASKELYIVPAFVDVFKEYLSYPLLTRVGEPEKTRIVQYRRKPYFSEIMIAAKDLTRIIEIVRQLKLPKPAKNELIEVIRSWLRK